MLDDITNGHSEDAYSVSDRGYKVTSQPPCIVTYC